MFKTKLLCLFTLLFSFSPQTGFTEENIAKGTSSNEWNDYKKSPLLPEKVKKQLKPYLIPKNHPLKGAMDELFIGKRPTLNENALNEAGFETLFVQPRSFIRVVKHATLPGHLLKIYLDNTLTEKKGKPDWYWFLKRCEGAEKIRKCLKEHKFVHFKVPQKYIYPLPFTPFPKNYGSLKQKTVVLLVENMRLVRKADNKLAWKTKITKSHLDELYVIIKECNGSSYRADNIPYSRKGYFTFIDTEYPERKPDFENIKRFLSADMLRYWEKLIANGGPS